MTVTVKGELEIDSERGVLYFHVTSSEDAVHFGAVTLLRICSLPTPIPLDRPLDITHMHGVNWHEPTRTKRGRPLTPEEEEKKKRVQDILTERRAEFRRGRTGPV